MEASAPSDRGIGHTGSLAKSFDIPEAALSFARSATIQFATALRSAAEILLFQWSILKRSGGIVPSSTAYSIFARSVELTLAPVLMASTVSVMS